ncbi:uncharacterized protein LOC143283533 [Babylonia areolata]|uniref:uncharacterized protein LOC143283533 n=1 Tax=Babylonia areolata TaxID=304850 RepID=UPI003FCF8DE9
MEKAGVGVHLWMVLFLVQVALWTVPCFSADLGETCGSGGEQCTVANSTCAANTCVCKDTHYQTNNTSCLERITLGQSCTGTTGTQGNCVSDAVCDSGTCRVAPGAGCNTTNQCVQNAACSGTGSTCQCNPGFYQSGQQCLARVAPGGGCTSGVTDQCVDNAACVSVTCQCNTGFYQSGQQCLARIPVGQSCAGNQTNCVSGAVCDSGTCRKDIGQSCSDPTGTQGTCVNCAVCNNGTCRKLSVLIS